MINNKNNLDNASHHSINNIISKGQNIKITKEESSQLKKTVLTIIITLFVTIGFIIAASRLGNVSQTIGNDITHAIQKDNAM